MGLGTKDARLLNLKLDDTRIETRVMGHNCKTDRDMTSITGRAPCVAGQAYALCARAGCDMSGPSLFLLVFQGTIRADLSPVGRSR